MAIHQNDRCRVCGGTSRFAFRRRLLGHEVSYFDCPACGYFQTEPPYWLKDAYASAINDVDTGILWRNQLNVQRVLMTLLAFGRLPGRVKDYAGGYGILVRLLRDIGVDAYWADKYCQNLLARGFEATESSHDLLTAFEAFEHFEEPMAELEQMLAQAPAVLLSTELVASSAPPNHDWWYLGPEHGQHIGFFRTTTLEWMARKLGCDYSSDGRSLHLFCRNRVPRRWLAFARLRLLAPLVAGIWLRSKTVDDFELLRRGR